jgi:hypothetical protein
MSVRERDVSSGPTRVLRTPAEAEGILEAWRELAAVSEGVSYFGTPDWVIGWWETLGREVDGEIALWEDASGTLDAVAALGRIPERIHPRLPFRPTVWRNLGSGTGAADHCGWPVRGHRLTDVRDWVMRKSSGEPVLLANLDPVTGVRFVPPGAQRVEVEACPRLDIGPHEGMGHSTSFRKKIRAYRRRLTREGVTFRWIAPEAMTDSLLEVVFDLHERRQSLKEGRTTFDRSRRSLHQRLVARSGPGRGPALVLAEANGEPVGVLYGFLWRREFAYYQSGWHPDWGPASLGTVLVAEAIQLAGKAGASVFDFLRGAEGYKYRFGAADRVDESWLVPTSLTGRLLSLKYGTKARLRSRQARRRRPGIEMAER